MRNLITYLIFLGLGFSVPLFAQTELSLEECIQRALEHSPPELGIAQLEQETSEIELKQQKLAYLPSLDLYGSGGMYVGRRIDPITNTFPTSAVFSNYYGLNLAVPVFSGLNQKYNIQQSRTQATINALNVVQSEKNNTREVIQYYYNVLDFEIAKSIHEDKIEQLNTEMDRVSQLIREERLTILDSLNILAQIDQVRLDLLEVDKQLATFKESLSVLIGSDPESIQLVLPDTSAHLMPELNLVGNRSTEQLRLETEGLEIEQRRAKFFYLPEVQLFGAFGSGYSSNNLDFSNTPPTVKPYGLQVRENLFQNVGVSLSMPLFNKTSNLKSIQTAAIRLKIQEERKRLLERQTTQRKNALSREWTQLTSSIEINKRLMNYAEIAFEAAKSLNEEQRITRFELNATRNEYYSAQLNYQRDLLRQSLFRDQLTYDVFEVE
ncbi:MAG: TolC family protein [Crocinitomicaceae bacterium]